MEEYNYSKFPFQNFPNLENLLTQEKRKQKLNLLFHNYGTQEAVLPQILEGNQFTWCSKNNGLLNKQNSSLNKFLSLDGSPQCVVEGCGSQEFYSPQNISDLCLVTSTDGLNLNVSGQVMNMMRDHPDICSQTFSQFANFFTFFNAKRNTSIKKNAVFHPKEVYMRKNTGLNSVKKCSQHFKSGGNFATFGHKHLQFDDTIFDVPKKLLCDILEEEVKSDFVNIYDDQSYNGGTIKSFNCNPDKSTYIAYPSGDNMDSLSISRINELKSLGNSNRIEEVEKFQLKDKWSEIRQTEISKWNKSTISIAARTQYNIEIFFVDDFKSPGQCSSRVQHPTVTNKQFSHFSLNPWKMQEVLSMTEDSTIRLWDVNRGCSEEAVTVIRNFDENKNKLNLQVEFSSNPRQLYFSDKNDVFLCDVRGKNLRERSIFNSADDHIRMILPGNKIQGGCNIACSYQLLVSTCDHLHLIDQRYPRHSLLKWAVNTDHPCKQMCSTSTLRKTSKYDYNCDIIVAMGNRHHVRCLHYDWGCNEKQVLPPMKSTLPLKMASFKCARSYKDIVPMTTGITAYQTSDESWKFLQIDQTGNIIEQGLNLIDKNDKHNRLKFASENLLHTESNIDLSETRKCKKYKEHLAYVEVSKKHRKLLSLDLDGTKFSCLDEIVEPELKLIDASLDEYQQDIEREKLLNAWTNDDLQVSIVEKTDKRTSVVTKNINNKVLQSVNRNYSEFKPRNNVLMNSLPLVQQSIKRPMDSNTKLKVKKKKKRVGF